MSVNLTMREEDEEDEEDQLTPREYQSVLLDIAMRQNTILFLPTGSGKTYVAIMLIKRMSADLFQPIGEGGKRTFFMVNTVALVHQQAEYLQRHASLSVGKYSGDMNVDFWTKDTWVKEFDEHQVLVMTSQIFLNILQVTYIRLQDVNLLIFDECHHAINDQPMRQIMTEFGEVPEEDQPRVLGLTATLLNSNCKAEKIPIEVKNLEITFRSKVATVDDISIVQSFSTNPVEKYSPFPATPWLPVMEQAKLIIGKYKDSAMDITLEGGEFEAPRLNISGLRNLKDVRKVNKKLRNLFDDVLIHIELLGIYGGSISALKHNIQLRRIRNKAEDKKTKVAFVIFINAMEMIRKLLEDHMLDCSRKARIYKYSSPKVLNLFEILRQVKPKEGDEDQETLRGIIFVERRFTAKIIYLILKDLHEYDEDFSFVNPDFMVGFQNNPYNNTREGALEKKWNHEAIYRFNKGHRNIIISSDVLEEGIDVQLCNLVVRFDEPKSYRSYIQSKGRARKKDSKFFLLIPQEDEMKSKTKYESYQEIENRLKAMLVGKNSLRVMPRKRELVEEAIGKQVYYAAGIGSSRVTINSAIALVNRYCSMLPQDKFTTLAPSWYIQETGNGCRCILELPINSPLRDTITSDVMPSQRQAKRAVALKTCEILHKEGELDDSLLPCANQSAILDCQELFEMYETEPENEADQPKPGTKKRRRYYRRKYPSVLMGCRPQENAVAYLHLILMKPVYPQPPEDDTRKLAFYNLLQSGQGYGIVSTKKLPPICQFPIFMNVGEVQVNIVCNAQKVFLDTEQIKLLQGFNTVVFYDVLKLCKQFMVVDKDNEEHSYFVVPTSNKMGIHEIDWHIVETQQRVPKGVQPTETQRLEMVIGQEYMNTVVIPWYRGLLPEQMYVVTRVCDDMFPSSKFPTKDYNSYEEYFHVKYKLSILRPEQPMLEVKAISTKINCVKPRSSKVGHGTSKRKRQELQEDFEEHLVPELCSRYTFPAALWLKATCMPTVLHRLHYLLLAEELRQKIARDLNFPLIEDTVWEPLPVDAECYIEDTTSSPSKGVARPANDGGTTNSSKAVHSHPWGDEKEPIDIDRERPEDLTLMDIQYYDDFISKSLRDDPTMSDLDKKLSERLNHDRNTRTSPFKKNIVPIDILDRELVGVGPQQYQILQALTTLSGNDVLNLERLETLGDSFLKFASSLFLFLYFPKLDEGKLSLIKGKMVGNRNLFYCGRAHDLGKMMKVHDFSPRSDWVPPGLCVPRKLQQVLRDAEVCPTMLYELILSESEQLSGTLSSDSQDLFREKVLECTQDISAQSSMESFIGLQCVVDKYVSDSVEGLIGAYLKAYGIRGALMLLGWLRVLPRLKASPEFMFDIPAPTAFVSPDVDGRDNIDFHLGDTEGLERRLGYRFQDRSFLLQALCHASYVQNRVTDCYQRLEFLGDAVLDFLITCHIYETCGKLSPGELTDLRSALVNNITFATLAVRNDFHKYYKFNSSVLFEKVDTFVSFQEERNHDVNEDVLILLAESECIAELVDVPKVLGDLFESLAGAIYLDSGKSLQEVWRVYYRLMEKEIRKFSECIPKTPVRLLYEKCQTAPVFHKTSTLEDVDKVMIRLDVLIRGEKHMYFGFGENKFSAKRAAAKLALKDL